MGEKELFSKNSSDKGTISWFPKWLKWLPTSNDKLFLAEQKLFERLTCNLDSFFVPICDSKYDIRTIVARNYDIQQLLNREEERIPILLIHGFPSGIGFWVKNLDSLSKNRRVFAFDLIGFGRSSRPIFPNSAKEVEEKFVQTIEEWRKVMKIEKFILIGHSMGGFLCSSYCINYYTHVAHLILVDPWGFLGKSEDELTKKLSGFGNWLLNKSSSFRALSLLRLVGPLGPSAIRYFRQDFEHIFYQTPLEGKEIETRLDVKKSKRDSFRSSNSSKKLSETSSKSTEYISAFDSTAVYSYIYQVNVQTPTGEDAFLRMSQTLGWAARPMLERIHMVDQSLPITFIYGGRSWMDMSSGLRAKAIRDKSYVDVMVIDGGGHHAYAQYADEFNSYVNAIAKLVDQNHVFLPGSIELVHKFVVSDTS